MITGQPHARVYGPVPSRRFGLSLGVDLVPHKVCCYDCVYCQVGGTTDKTARRQDFYPAESILRDLKRALVERPTPDVITLAGSGEPTLYRGLGLLVDRIRSLTSLPLVLLTGGGLLADEAVAAEAMKVDVLAPSLDAGGEAQFLAINRPCSGIRFDAMLHGLARVTSRFSGTTRLEVMILPGFNDTLDSIDTIANLVKGMRLSAIDLNTPVRPVHGSGIGIASSQTLAYAMAAFGPTSHAIGEFSRVATGSPPHTSILDDLVVETLARRPCTMQDMVAALASNASALDAVLQRLVERGIVEERRSRHEVYFWAPEGGRPGSSPGEGAGGA